MHPLSTVGNSRPGLWHHERNLSDRLQRATRLAHCSDLHFGDQPPGLAQALAAALGRADPDLVVISGDLTQRARVRQFREARSWMDSLGRPVLVVPGNHDLPLLAFWKRLLLPRRAFRQTISPDRTPCWRSDDVFLCGMDSTRRWRWKAGRARAWRAGHGAQALQMLAVHHPLPAWDPRAGQGRPHPPPTPVTGVDVLLAGHDHHSRVDLLPTATSPSGLLQVVAGTALSRRLRGEPHSFFLLDIRKEQENARTMLLIQRWVAEDVVFAPAETRQFTKALARQDGMGRLSQPGDSDSGWEERSF
ncbi:metallophosphoesterase family protein [Megalodesulfovibrio paquesii]